MTTKCFAVKTLAFGLFALALAIPFKAEAQGIADLLEQQPAPQRSIVGDWQLDVKGKNGVTARLTLSFLKNGRFGWVMNRSDGVKIERQGTWKLENGQLTSIVNGKVFSTDPVTWRNADSIKLRTVVINRVRTINNVNPAPAPNRGVNLAGTTWEGTENLQGFGKLTFQFRAGGQVSMIDSAGTSQGSWSVKDGKIVLLFANGQVAYVGQINGQLLSGTAANARRTTWKFNVRLQPSGLGA